MQLKARNQQEKLTKSKAGSLKILIKSITSSKLIKEKRVRSQITNIRSEEGDITMNPIDIKGDNKEML